MGIYDSTTAFVKARDDAASDGNYNARNTFMSILDVMYKAGTHTCKKWAEHTETIIESVLNGNYAGTSEDAKKLLNRLSKNGKK